ncbi:MAG: cation:proton antiporter [Thermodesulfobacteriota bacterium]|nr:cation:proton antiporter [Thermodesulfobacteriota bacterium]
MSNWFTINSLQALGILFTCGYFGGQFANWLKFPRVSGYILAGILLSPSLSGLIPEELIKDRFSIVIDISLAIIAYSIGGSLKLSRLKQLGKSIFWVTVSQALGAFFLSFILIMPLGFFNLNFPLPNASFWEVYLPLALIIGAVSTATAPAAVLAIVHEYKARGPLTTTLLGVVALDDGIAIIFYSFAMSIAGALMKVGDNSIFYQMTVEPLLIISGSILLGALFGCFITGLACWVKKKGSLLVLILGGILLCTGIAEQIKLSPLLANMMVGFYVVNRAKHSEALFQTVENIEEPIFALFFTLAGAHFDLAVIRMAGFLSLLIVVGRFSGKLLGTKLGAGFSHAPLVVKKYLGYALLPKAGVTIGLILLAESLMEPQVGEIMVNAVLGSVIINELIAPPLVKFALKGADEIAQEE